MATVVYALSGEGRGHATRAQTVIEELRGQHDIKVYAYGQAADFLAPIYRATQVEVRRIPGLQFHYTTRGSLDYFRTLLSSTCDFHFPRPTHGPSRLCSALNLEALPRSSCRLLPRDFFY